MNYYLIEGQTKFLRDTVQFRSACKTRELLSKFVIPVTILHMQEERNKGMLNGSSGQWMKKLNPNTMRISRV